MLACLLCLRILKDKSRFECALAVPPVFAVVACFKDKSCFECALAVLANFCREFCCEFVFEIKKTLDNSLSPCYNIQSNKARRISLSPVGCRLHGSILIHNEAVSCI